MTRDARRETSELRRKAAAGFPRHAFLVTRLAVLSLGVTACRDAFTSNVDVVARAGTWELTVDRLGEIFAQSKALAARRDVVERVAELWVDYALYAQRAVAGDSMLDSAGVLAVLWPEVQQRKIDHFHDTLILSGVHLDSARVDSTYRAGQLRLVRQVLVRTEPAMAPAARAARRKEADAIRVRLAGGGSWAEANQKNQDTRSKPNGGSLGVVARGDLMTAVEDAAFALEPGGLSGVVESALGYHVVSRPRLKDVRAEFRQGVEDWMVARLDSAYLGGLPARRHFKVLSDAPPKARVAIADPVRSAGSRALLGTFDGGRFTVGDLVRWLRAMPTQIQGQVVNADDTQLDQFIRQLMRNQAMMVEADSVGIGLTPLDLVEFQGILRRDLAQLSQAVGIDAKALPGSGADGGRDRMAALKVDQYLEAVAANRATFVGVPPFLSERLREQGDWRVVSAGIDRVLSRTEVLKAAMDSARAASPEQPEPVPAPPQTDSGGKANAKR